MACISPPLSRCPLTAPPGLSARCSGPEGWSWQHSGGTQSARSKTAPWLRRRSDEPWSPGHPDLRTEKDVCINQHQLSVCLLAKYLVRRWRDGNETESLWRSYSRHPLAWSGWPASPGRSQPCSSTARPGGDECFRSSEFRFAANSYRDDPRLRLLSSSNGSAQNQRVKIKTDLFRNKHLN